MNLGQKIRARLSFKNIGQLESISAYMFIAPFYLLFAIFKVYPVLFSLYVSFFKWNGFGPMRPVGLKNYVDLVNDASFWKTLSNTTFIWLGNVFLVVGLGFLLALLLDSQHLTFKGLFRGIFYIPQTIAVVAIALTFAYIFDTEFGVINLLLKALSVPKVPWLIDGTWAKISLIILIVWRVAPWHMVVMLAGLQSIDGSVYEAARIDGATFWQTTMRITIPLLKPIFFYCFLMATISSFKTFAEPYALTGGGPGEATRTLSLYMYQNGFEFLKLGYASAISYVLIAIIMVISVVQMVFFRSEVE